MATLPKISGVSMSGGVRSLVEPFCVALENLAHAMQAAGVGLSLNGGHVQCCRAMASSMRADAAMGRYPHEYTDRDGKVHAAAAAVPVDGKVLAMLHAHGVEISDGFITIDLFNELTAGIDPGVRLTAKVELARTGKLIA